MRGVSEEGGDGWVSRGHSDVPASFVWDVALSYIQLSPDGDQHTI